MGRRSPSWSADGDGGVDRQRLSARRAGGTSAAAGGAHRRARLAARQSVLFAGEYRADADLHLCSSSGWCRRLLRFFVFDAVWSAADRRRCLASPANPNSGRLLGLRARLVLLFRLWLLSDRRALARRSVFRGTRLRHCLARLAVGAAPRPRRAVFFRRAADPVLCAVKRRTAGRPRRRFDLAVGRHFGHHRRRDGRHRVLAAARYCAGAGTAVRSSGRETILGDLHRIRPRRAADHRAVHGERHAAAVRARPVCAG